MSKDKTAKLLYLPSDARCITSKRRRGDLVLANSTFASFANRQISSPLRCGHVIFRTPRRGVDHLDGD